MNEKERESLKKVVRKLDETDIILNSPELMIDLREGIKSAQEGGLLTHEEVFGEHGK